MQTTKNHVDEIAKLQASLALSFQRAVVCLQGSDVWCLELAQCIAADKTPEDVLWISNIFENALLPKQARTQLGREYQLIIFDCRYDFDLDALGAVSGTLYGGGVLLLLMPKLNDWVLLKNSRYLQMIKPLLAAHKSLYSVRQGEDFYFTGDTQKYKYTQDILPPFLSADQKLLVEEMEINIQQDNAVIVLLASRGRGKSSALGLLVGRLLNQGLQNIVLTAPRLSICDCTFLHAKNLLKNTHSQRGKLFSDNALLEFKAPDVLLDEWPDAELLIVDEAAAIPLPMLAAMLQHYPKIIFSSTLYGYEGTGRGFALKFSKILDKQVPHWQKKSMQMPVRWAQNDPLESWIDELLCLHTELKSVEHVGEIKFDDLKIFLLDKNKLIENPQQRNDLFALLVSAHYRTRPSDFQFLLDQKNIRIYVLCYQQQVLAAVVVNQEGAFDKTLSAAIYRGERRPKGHLLAQTLCFHVGVEAAAYYRYGRIMRIAVHPEVQRKGLGSYLMQAVIKQEAGKVDMLGTSFAASAGLLDFWKKQKFEMVRLGFTRDHVSASHSAVMLKPVNNKSAGIFLQLRKKFQRSIAYCLSDALAGIEVHLKEKLLLESIVDEAELSDMDWRDIRSFAYFSRGYEACSPAIYKFVLCYVSIINGLGLLHQNLIQQRVVEKIGWSECVQNLSLQGKKHALKELRVAIAQLLKMIKKEA